MPIIGKPLLVLGSLAGVSLLGTGGYFGISHLVSSNSQQPEESNSSSQDSSNPRGAEQEEQLPSTDSQPVVEPSARPDGQTQEASKTPSTVPTEKNVESQGALGEQGNTSREGVQEEGVSLSGQQNQEVVSHTSQKDVIPATVDSGETRNEQPSSLSTSTEDGNPVSNSVQTTTPVVVKDTESSSPEPEKEPSESVGTGDSTKPTTSSKDAAQGTDSVESGGSQSKTTEGEASPGAKGASEEGARDSSADQQA